MSYLATLAKETGWSMEFILWRLPYSTGLGMIHSAAIRKGVTMELVNGRPVDEDELGGMREAFQAMRARYADRLT